MTAGKPPIIGRCALRGPSVLRVSRRALLGSMVSAGAVAGLPLAWPARSEVRVDVTRGVLEPLPIAVTRFLGEEGRTGEIGREMTGVIARNLEGSGLFQPVDERAFAQQVETIGARPRFADWRAFGIQALVQGAVANEPDGRLRVEFRLWDMYAEQQMTGLAYFTQPDNWRRVAHIVSDAIYKRLTGEEGYFDTRIVYVSEAGPAQNRVKRLAVMDQDGANHTFLTDGSNLVLTPRFAQSRQEISFLAYDGAAARVNLMNLDDGRHEVLGRFPGMTFAPRFSPNGDQLVFSMAREGTTDVYVMDMRTRNVRQVTQHSAIDTSPSFAPDAQQIVFNSDRGGNQQLYVMNVDGGNVRRISFGDGRYATPVWSPRGDLIAFTRIFEGRFGIGVMRPDGSRERMLSESFYEEGPTWAPNGRVLMFFRQERTDRTGAGGRSRLYTVDITGRNLREVQTPQDASDPAWSPLGT